MKRIILGSLFFASIAVVSVSEATPDYAVRFNNISCTSCHYNPTGGGPLKHNGKLFQGRWFETAPLEIQNYLSANFRALAYFPEKAKTTKGGMGVMSGSVALHAPLSEKKDTFLVIENNFAGFSAAPLRDTYLLYNFNKDGVYSWYESLLVGRFRAPFGIVTDEHRTYTRFQTGTRWYDFETGMMFSGTPSSKLHYDIALVNGKNFSGQTLNPGQSEQWGQIVNLRYMPSFYLFGVSASNYKTTQAPDSRALSLYSIVSLARVNNLIMPATVKLEYSQAQGFNSILNQGFASDPNYVTAVQNSKSQAILARIDWLLTNKITLTYKFDWLTPDMDFPADVYDRHGVGVRWAISANTNLLARTELARATQPSESVKTGQLAQNATFFILEAIF